MSFGPHSLRIDPAAETEWIVARLRETIGATLRRRGAVVGVSGGIDSSVALALAVRAVGAPRVLALILPEKDSDPESADLGRLLAARYGVEPVVEDITAALEGFGCYRRRDEAIRRVFPEYDAAQGYRARIELAGSVLDEDSLNVYRLTVVTPSGETKSQRLPPHEYFQIVAASNLKQRTRTTMLYYYAELHHYAVVGTTNRNEHAQGFFVKYGDGASDVRPISHLLKTQIFQLAEYLDVPETIRQRTPTTDTYSAPQTQEEFFYRLPFTLMDLLWAAREQGVPAGEAAAALGLTEIQVRRAFDDFGRKQRTTDYLRQPPLDLASAPMGPAGNE